MDRRSVIKAGLAGLAASALPTPAAFAQAKLVLKATDVHPLGYPTVEAVVQMGKKLETATNGRLSVQMYPSMQLGGEKEMIEQAQVGALAMARISVGPMGPIVPELNVFNLPFMFRDDAHMEKVIDGAIGVEMLKKLSNSAANLVGLCWMNAGTRNVYNSKKPIATVEDLKGLKIRMMGNPVFVDTMNSLGGNGVSMGFDQLINAMQTGVVDGAENNYPTYESGQHYRYAKYYSKTGHLMIPEILVFSKRIWGTLAKEDQDLILKLAKEAQQEERTLRRRRPRGPRSGHPRGRVRRSSARRHRWRERHPIGLGPARGVRAVGEPRPGPPRAGGGWRLPQQSSRHRPGRRAGPIRPARRPLAPSAPRQAEPGGRRGECPVNAAFATGALASALAAAGLTALVVWVATVLTGSSDPWSVAPWLIPVVALVVGAATFLAERYLHEREGARKRATGEPWAYRE